ncbi:luciferin sulfotransferase [Glossina fuscipes]|uniref:Luciferin sulfotransferase n=1 Tax=Glossina fuscipes TaxID=7396 RepID=A0A9C5Z5B1_9MUSC|nr:luciferin sulfotransferase [Glossina fuscipes]
MEFEQFVPESYPKDLLDKDWKERKCYCVKGRRDFLCLVHNMFVKNDDVWLVTLPKCGTTWMQELLWLVINNFDFNAAKSEHLEIRTPFLEFEYIVNEDLKTALRPVEMLTSPRLIKSHLPLPLLPAQLWSKLPKLIYVYRDPKDALISQYYFGRSMGFNMDKTLEQFLTEKIESRETECDFDHVTEFYFLRSQPWLYYTSFERMKINLRQIIEDICQFLDRSISEEQMHQMLKHLSFEEMKANTKTNHIWEIEQVRAKHRLPYEDHSFVRKGKVGGFKEELSPEFISRVDSWINKHLMRYNVTLNDLLLLND